MRAMARAGASLVFVVAAIAAGGATRARDEGLPLGIAAAVFFGLAAIVRPITFFLQTSRRHDRHDQHWVNHTTITISALDMQTVPNALRLRVRLVHQFAPRRAYISDVIFQAAAIHRTPIADALGALPQPTHVNVYPTISFATHYC